MSNTNSISEKDNTSLTICFFCGEEISPEDLDNHGGYDWCGHCDTNLDYFDRLFEQADEAYDLHIAHQMD